jgi:hypothetical protein
MWKLLAFLLLMPGVALAQTVTYSNCSGTVGTAAANVTFPSAGYTGPAYPQNYLAVQNNSTSGQIIWFNVNGGTATTAAPNWQLVPTAGFNWTLGDGVPASMSVIASASGAALSCFYR